MPALLRIGPVKVPFPISWPPFKSTPEREIHAAAVEVDRACGLNDAAIPFNCAGGQHMECAAAVRGRACAGEIECRAVAREHHTVVGEASAPVEVECLARDVGLDDAGCAVDNAEAAVADLAAAAYKVVGIRQSAITALVIDGGIYTSKRYYAPTREDGIAGDEDARVGRGRECAVVNERVLEISGIVTARRDGGPCGNGDVANRPSVEGEDAGGPGVVERASDEFAKEDGHIRAVLGTDRGIVIEGGAGGSVEDKCAAVLGAHQTVVSEGAAPVEVEELARDVGLDDAAASPLMTLKLS